MPVYYLAAYPDTVVSLVKTGKLPDKKQASTPSVTPRTLGTPSSQPQAAFQLSTDNKHHKQIDNQAAKLPLGASPSAASKSQTAKLVCTQDISKCLPNNRYPIDQVFILEVALAKEHATSPIISLDVLPSESIQTIYVHSTRGDKLIKQLFKNACPKPVSVRAEIYRPASNTPSSSTAKKEPTPTTTTSAKKDEKREKQEKQTIGVKRPSSQLEPSASPSSKKARTEAKELVTRITTFDEHLRVLRSAFQEAHRSVLICSFSIHHDMLERNGIYALMLAARARGVRIYIYCGDRQQSLDQRVASFFTANNISYAQTYTHSKILAVDKRWVATGSFNWLAMANNSCEEGSFVCRDEMCKDFIEEFWKYIKHYRSLQFGTARFRFEDDPNTDSTLIYDMKNGSEVSYLPTLNQQCGFFQHCFDSARQRLIICSPFISSARWYEEDMDLATLQKTVRRNVDIYFVCRSDATSLADFRLYLASVNSPRIHLVTVDNFHLKTIIMDDDLIAEGSFNWLSATRDDESDYHNHEQTLSVQGRQALPLIEHFFQSRTGRAVFNVMCGQMCEQVEKQNNSTSSSSLSSSTSTLSSRLVLPSAAAAMTHAAAAAVNIGPHLNPRTAMAPNFRR
jgi:phosphatidylserine/phosphatidylglycerophosphate/cardiolipin synthase-like enzyme